MSYYHHEDWHADDFNKIDAEIKQNDRDYNAIYRLINKDGLTRRRKIALYTSGVTGSHIRDAETGDYYTSKVGSLDEYAFYKVILATGECRSRSGTSTLFFRSPEHFMSHLQCNLDQKVIQRWADTKDALLAGRPVKYERAAIVVRRN
jgi:hypothetical protein